MAIVKDNPNGDKGTSEGMAVYKFAGMPIEQFELVPETGDTRVITVRVECVSVGTEQIKDGDRKFVKWRVVNAAIGRELPDEKPSDPTLPGMGDDDGANEAYGDYTGNDDEVGEDGYTNRERRELNGDTPTPATESESDETSGKSNVRSIQPAFSSNA